MAEKENIRLDAILEDVIGTSAFRAKLANGHEITAFIARPDRGASENPLCRGTKVVVDMSPFDMSKGRIILSNETG